MDAEKELLSVIVPIYNAQQYLKQCLDSIINQRYRNLEIILVDDGSTDQSGVIADSYKKDSRVKVIHKKQEGPSKARWEGVQKAKGKYVAFVDADDWIAETMYMDMMQHINENDLDIITCGICRYWSDTKSLKHQSFLKEGFYDEAAIVEEVYPVMLWDTMHDVYGVDPSLCSKIMKRDIVAEYMEKALRFHFYLGDDTAVLYPAMLTIKRFYVMHECYYYHRQRENGDIASYIKDPQFFENLFNVYQYLREQFGQSLYADILQRQLEFFYMRFIQLRKQYYYRVEDKPEAIFPFTVIEKDSKVILYGAGKVGCTYMKQNEKNKFCEVVLWVDKNYRNFGDDWKIAAPREINRQQYDYIILAVQTAALAEEIKQELIAYGVPEKKIIWAAANMQSFLR